MEITINYYGQAVSVSVEVSEEVFDVLCQSVREMRNYERRKRAERDRLAAALREALAYAPPPRPAASAPTTRAG